MGKGNRTRNERATSALATVAAPRKASNQKRAMPTWVGTLILVAVLALVVLFVVFTILNSRGTFLRMRTIAKSENYKVTVPMMSYMVYTEYQNRVATYEEYSELYGTTISIGGGDGGDALDTSLALRDQIYSSVTGADGSLVETTWFDYFAGLAEADVRQILACCEEALAADMELDDADRDEIKAELESIKAYADSYGYTTSAYVSMMYGKGVILKDVRKMMELTQLAAKWSEYKQGAYKEDVDDDRINAYYDENKDTYEVYCDYMGYTFTASFTPDEDDDATENARLMALYEEEKELLAGLVDRLTAEGMTVEKFSKELYDCVYEYERWKVENAGSDLTEAECSAIAEDAVLNATYSNMSQANDDSELDEWLFEKEDGSFVRVENDVKAVMPDASEEESEEGSSEEGSSEEGGAEEQSEEEPTYEQESQTFSAYIFVDGMHCTTEVVHSVGHILFDSDTYDGLTSTATLTGEIKELADKVLKRDGIITAYAMAGELLDMLEEEGKITYSDDKERYFIDKSVFEEYGEIFTADSSVFYDDVPKGQMVAEFETWLFDASRIEGEITYPEPIETSYGYHIMFYVGNETETWKSEIISKLSTEDYNEYLEGISAIHPVEVKTDYYGYIAG